MKHRTFLLTFVFMATIGPTAFLAQEKSSQTLQIMTVLGSIAPQELGITLPHEHVLVDFIGAEKITKDRYEINEAYQIILPYLYEIKEMGCQSLMECTPAYIGRDPVLLQRLAKSTGMHLITNTGYYGAANDKFVPAHAYQENANQLAKRRIHEWEHGIEGTGVRPGFIKIGVDAGALSDIDKKLVQAAARTHLQTGLTIAAHTSNTDAGLEELKVIQDAGLNPDAFIWVHAQNEWDDTTRIEAAQKGAWIEIDNVSSKNIDSVIEKIKIMKKNGLLHRVLLSHDAGWYSPGESQGGSFRSYTPIFKDFIPALKKAGFHSRDIHQLMVNNPREALAIRVRKAKD